MRDILTIGEIDLTNQNISEVFVGNINTSSISKYKVEVYSNEGQIPHFHIIGKSTKFQCCPCIFYPLYFNHGIKTNTLSKTQLKELNEWLSKPCKNFGNVLTNWEVIMHL